jgi:hypothetical protein
MISESMLNELDIANMTEAAAQGSLHIADGFYAPIQQRSEAEIGFLATPQARAEGVSRSIATADQDGLINIILANPVVPPELQALLEEQQQNLIDLVGVGTRYIRKQAEADPNKKYDVALWQQVFNHLPLMGPSKFTRQTFSRQVRGIEIAKTFIDFLLNAVVLGQGAALKEFSEFLQGQGEAIRIGTERNQDGFTMGSIGIILETMEVAGKTQLLPKIKANFVDFTRQNYQFTAMCVKRERVNINFISETAVSLFNYKALERPDVKEAFGRFIGKTQKDDITDADNFFNGGEGFPTGPAAVALTGSIPEIPGQSNHDHDRITELERMVGHLMMQLESVKQE